MHSTKLDFVRQLIQMGIAVMPLYHRSKEPMLPSWGWLQSLFPDTEYLTQWFATDWNNYGVICGWGNLVVLDFDTFEWFDLWRATMHYLNMNWVVATSFKVITAHGMHVYLRTTERAENSKRIARSAGIDVQAQGRYVVGPGCTHPTGTQYVPVGELHLVEVPNVETILPVDLFPRVTAETAKFNGTMPEFVSTNTECQNDPFAQASMDAMDLISKIKASVRIETLFAGVQRSSVDGRWLKALCPFHDDKHQSAWIDTLRQLAGCQVCGMPPMDVINVFSRMRNISVSAAVTALAEEIGVWR